MLSMTKRRAANRCLLRHVVADVDTTVVFWLPDTSLCESQHFFAGQIVSTKGLSQIHSKAKRVPSHPAATLSDLQAHRGKVVVIDNYDSFTYNLSQVSCLSHPLMSSCCSTAFSMLICFPRTAQQIGAFANEIVFCERKREVCSPERK